MLAFSAENQARQEPDQFRRGIGGDGQVSAEA